MPDKLSAFFGKIKSRSKSRGREPPEEGKDAEVKVNATEQSRWQRSQSPEATTSGDAAAAAGQQHVRGRPAVTEQDAHRVSQPAKPLVNRTGELQLVRLESFNISKSNGKS